MSLEGEMMSDLIPKVEDTGMDSEDVLRMTQFEEEAGNLMSSDMQAVVCAEENEAFASDPGEATEQFLTISQGANQISVNDDGSIIYSEQGLATATDPLEQPQSVESPFVNLEGNAFYLQPNDGLDDQIMPDDILPSTTNDLPDFSGNTFLYNKADGTLTQVSNTSNTITLSSGAMLNTEVKNLETVQPDVVKTVKRPAYLAAAGAGVKMGTRKVFVQNTSKGPVMRTISPSVQKIGGTKTISLAQAQRMGLFSSSNKIFIKKVGGGLANSSGSNTVVMRQPVKMLPRSVASTVMKPQAFRTHASSPQLKTLITTSMAQPKTVVVNKTIPSFSIGGRPAQKLMIRPGSQLVRTVQVAGKPQVLKVISSSSATKPRIATVSHQQNSLFLPKSTVLAKQVNVASLLKSSANSSLTFKGKSLPIVSSPPEIVTLDTDEPMTIKVEDASEETDPLANATGVDDADMSEPQTPDIDDEQDLLADDNNDETPGRPDSPQKLLVANGIRPKKPCNCTRSQCLKLYCECFANGEFCFECNCTNCFNNIEHEEDRQVSITACLERNPDAFRRKMQVATALSDSEEEKERRQNRGCNCKKSHCLKNYCECFEGKLNCCESCKCTGCRNTEEDMAAWMRGETIDSGDEGRDVNGKGNPFMPKALAEALCQCILVQAELSDRAGQDVVTTERRIIEELGQRLVQIIGNRSKKDSR